MNVGKRTLVGIDFSPGSDVALAQARALCRGGELILVQARGVETDVPPWLVGDRVDYRAALAEQAARDDAALERLAARVAGPDCQASHRSAAGFPDAVLVALAGELACDLVVVGSHGRTGLRRLLLGSVAERVVRLAPCSVLVARPGDDAAGAPRSIAVATDFSAHADAALDAALAVRAPGAIIHAVHCWELPLSIYEGVTLESLGRMKDELIARAREHGAALAARDPAIRFHAVEDSPVHGIQSFAEQHACDLVVVGSHGRRGIRRFLLGSVAEGTVRHAPCSVLVARVARAGGDA
jgi:nucleotide-binding universal stress UspA family protein